MATYNDYLNFVSPTKNIRELYRADVSENRSGWTQTHVKVMRKVDSEDSQEPSWKQVAEYDRNYGMLKTFEPFQQPQDGIWRHYALISTKYTRLEVLDLQTGEIVATEAWPKASKEYAERTNGKVKAGDELPGSGFCPMEFYVPDWWDEFDETYLAKKDPETGELTNAFNSESYAVSTLDEFSFYKGQWGVYGGCLWGDDSSVKIRYVDLSRVNEGIVTTDERFGYLSLPDNLTIREAVEVNTEDGYLRIATPIMFNLDTGKALGKNAFTEFINWEEN